MKNEAFAMISYLIAAIFFFERSSYFPIIFSGHVNF